uniref:Uncharacterized protein n=1 Tax=Talaromyces marneffei PM1 TaxID=1077442 RepID=A0A093V6F4_TALMA
MAVRREKRRIIERGKKENIIDTELRKGGKEDTRNKYSKAAKYFAVWCVPTRNDDKIT